MNFFQNKKILITAGPTHEPIDPVRFIGNRSSGKMGFAIAEELANRGAKVYLVSGPVNISTINSTIEIIKVQTAEEMYQACHKVFAQVDVAILAAAVADFTIKDPASQKIKKKKDANEMVLTLVKTKDILKTLGKIKTKKQTLIGFALETNNEKENALKKLVAKNLNFIVLNSLQDKGAGFAYDTNKITILDNNNNNTIFELKTKQEVATDIVDYLVNYKK
jgi:phosphopantothenoylcysteine decarboxylase/phosphopantothenate--cysteine ligase